MTVYLVKKNDLDSFIQLVNKQYNWNGGDEFTYENTHRAVDDEMNCNGVVGLNLDDRDNVFSYAEATHYRALNNSYKLIVNYNPLPSEFNLKKEDWLTFAQIYGPFIKWEDGNDLRDLPPVLNLSGVTTLYFDIENGLGRGFTPDNSTVYFNPNPDSIQTTKFTLSVLPADVYDYLDEFNLFNNYTHYIIDFIKQMSFMDMTESVSDWINDHQATVVQAILDGKAMRLDEKPKQLFYFKLNGTVVQYDHEDKCWCHQFSYDGEYDVKEAQYLCYQSQFTLDEIDMYPELTLLRDSRIIVPDNQIENKRSYKEY